MAAYVENLMAAVTEPAQASVQASAQAPGERSSGLRSSDPLGPLSSAGVRP
jgi:hypothetical protein